MTQNQTSKDKQINVENKEIVNSLQQKVLSEDKLATNTSKKKILVAEDDPSIRRMFSRVLGNQYDVVITSNGKEAFDKFKEIKADLIITDLSMPVMDGFQFFTEIKKIYPEAKILLMTGAFDESKIKMMLENGAIGILNKPFLWDELIKNINSALSEKSE